MVILVIKGLAVSLAFLRVKIKEEASQYGIGFIGGRERALVLT